MQKKQIILIAAAGFLLLGGSVLMSSAYRSAPAAALHHYGNEPSSELQKALDLLYKDKNPQKSLDWFEKELAARPDNAWALYEYGNALFALKQFEKAEKNYQKSANIESSYQDEAAYNYVRASLAQGKMLPDAGQWLMRASQAGFSDYQKMLSDEYFAKYRKEYDFMSTFAEVFHYDKKAVGEAFWALSPKAEKEEYVLNVNDLYTQKNQKEVAQGHWAFEELTPGVAEGAFSRSNQTDDFSQELAYRHTKNYYAVIYKQEVTWGDGLLPNSYFLVTYSNEGEVIDRLKLAYRDSNVAQTVKMQGDLIETQGYTVQVDQDKAKLLQHSPTNERQQYQLSETGKIVHI